MGIEAVQEPDGVRLDALVPPAMGKQREQSMAWVVGVFNDFLGLPFTPPDIEVLDVRELSWAVHTTLCSARRSRAVLLPYQAVMQSVRVLSMVQL